MKITIVMLLALGIATMLRRQPAALRHWILACAVACGAATPALSQLLPAWQIGLTRVSPAVLVPSPVRVQQRAVPEPPSDARTASEPPAAAALTPAAQTRSFGWWLGVLWIAGTVFGCSVVLLGLIRLKWLAAGARVVTTGPWREITDRIAAERSLRRPVLLLQTGHPSLLVTWGTLRPRVLLPAASASWSPDRIGIVLRHELAHVERCDWAVQMIAELLKAAYWFNPAIWLVGRRLRLESEQACDDLVVNSGIDPSDYASHLLDLARVLNQQPRTWLPAPAIARPSSLRRRIIAMLNTHRNRHSTPALLRAAAAALFVAATVAIAAAQAPFATLAGSVVDSTGGVIPGASMMLSHNQSGVKHQVKTDATGRFEFVGLSAGDYVLESSTVGFATGRDTFTLSPGQLLSRSVVLQVGTLNETITVTDSDAPARVANRRAEPREPKPCAPAAVGGRIVPPLKLVDVKPIYPLNLRPSKASGVVEMDATIGPDGSVTAVNVVSSPEPDMSAAAVAAVREWKFSPTLLNCAPIDVNMHVRTTFQGQP